MSEEGTIQKLFERNKKVLLESHIFFFFQKTLSLKKVVVKNIFKNLMFLLFFKF